MSVLELSLPEGPFSLSCAAVDREAVHCFFNGGSEELRQAVQAHLGGCPRCRGKLRVFQWVWALDGARRKLAGARSAADAKP